MPRLVQIENNLINPDLVTNIYSNQWGLNPRSQCSVGLVGGSFITVYMDAESAAKRLGFDVENDDE